MAKTKKRSSPMTSREIRDALTKAWHEMAEGLDVRLIPRVMMVGQTVFDAMQKVPDPTTESRAYAEMGAFTNMLAVSPEMGHLDVRFGDGPIITLTK